MIPAILSAVFVVYLYKTLNSESPSRTAAENIVSADQTAQAIASRISELQTRVERVGLEVAKKVGKK